MWILHFLPDSFIQWVVNIVLFAGAGISAVGFFLGWVPGISAFKFPLKIIGVVLLVAGAYFKGGYSTEMEWRARVAEMEAKVKVAEAKSKKANAQVQTKIVTKIVKIHDKAAKAKTIIQQNKEVINRDCKLSDEAISAYNFSITKTKPEEKK